MGGGGTGGGGEGAAKASASCTTGGATLATVTPSAALRAAAGVVLSMLDAACALEALGMMTCTSTVNPPPCRWRRRRLLRMVTWTSDALTPSSMRAKRTLKLACAVASNVLRSPEMLTAMVTTGL